MSIPLAGSGNNVRKGLGLAASSSSSFFRSRFLVPRQGSERDLANPFAFNCFGRALSFRHAVESKRDQPHCFSIEAYCGGATEHTLHATRANESTALGDRSKHIRIEGEYNFVVTPEETSGIRRCRDEFFKSLCDIYPPPEQSDDDKRLAPLSLQVESHQATCHMPRYHGSAYFLPIHLPQTVSKAALGGMLDPELRVPSGVLCKPVGSPAEINYVHI